MKRILSLIVAMLAIVGMAQAQTVYSVGNFTGSNGSSRGALYINDEMTCWLDGTAKAVVQNPNNGDVYWANNFSNEDGTANYGDVIKMNGTRYLSNPYGSGTYINSLCWDSEWWNQTPEDCLISVGYKTGSDGLTYAVAWCGNNTADFWHPGFGNGNQSKAYGMTYYRRNHNDADCVYYLYCGTQCVSGVYNPRATVWRWGDVLYTLSSNNSYAYDIDYYNGDVYTVGIDTDPETHEYVATVWQNDYVLYRLADASADSRAWKIQVVGGDVYVCGWGTLRTNCIWKNGEPLYTYTASNTTAIDVTSDGVYAAVYNIPANQGYVYKDGQVLYTPNQCEVLNDICVYNPCQESEVRTLPYFEGFETGETDWECWTVTDEDDNFSSDWSAGYASYWHRMGSGPGSFGTEPATGDYCAAYRYLASFDQEGWLISPPIYLQPNQDFTELSFKTYEGAYFDMRYEGVLISTTNTNPSSFTQIWQQNNASNSWKTETIDLSAYQGQIVYIAFKYAGQDGHNWLIDDISLTEGWGPCSEITSYPYLDEFENGMGCYNIFDMDHSGGQRNWKLTDSEHYSGSKCMEHPWGQSNMPQEGWAFTRTFDLEAGQNYTFSFMNKNYSSGANMHNSVWIATGVNEPEPSDCQMIWEQTGTYPTTWTEVDIDLTPYAGNDITLAFKYEGTYAHNWYIDDIRITETAPEYEIIVNSNNASWGNVNGGGTYTHGATCTITATPNNGYEFLKWTMNNTEVTTDPSFTFTVTEDATYTAIFGEHSITYYTIATQVSPAEAGSVDGAGTYQAGATAYLSATANTGWYFSHWNDGVTANPRSVTVNSDATYVANFLQEEYTITTIASPAEGGTVTGGGNYHYGDVATLTATPSEDYVFYSWSDGVTQSTRTVTVVGNATYSAIFTTAGAATYTITVVSGNPFLGTVYGGGEYPEGSVIQISAEPTEYAYFDRWDDGNTENPREVVVESDKTYTAKFLAYQNYTITVESSNLTMGTVEGGGTFMEGSEIVIKAIPNEGFYFTSWDDGNAENPRTVVVTENKTFKANFSENATYSYTITTMCNPNEGSVYGAGTYAQGTSVMLIALPNTGYEFDYWDDGNRDNPRNIVVTGNQVYVAFFKSMGVDDNEMRQLVLYPNPASSVIRIAGLEANSEVSIYNAYGMLVKNVSAGADEEIGIGELAAGVYIVRCGNAVVRFVKM